MDPSEIVLMRAGHYFDAGSGGCQGATVAQVHAPTATGGTLVNLDVLEHNGSHFTRAAVPVIASPSSDDTSNSFHLTRDCPWGR